MSKELLKQAVQKFSIASRMKLPQGVNTSGTIPMKTIVDITFPTASAVQSIADGLTDLAFSMQQIEEKLNAVMKKLQITVAIP